VLTCLTECFQDINSVDVSGDFLSTGSQDKSCKIWNVNDLSLLTTLTGHRRGVWSCKFIGRRLVTASADCTIKVWLINCKKKEKMFSSSLMIRRKRLGFCHKHFLTGLLFSSNVRSWLLEWGLRKMTYSVLLLYYSRLSIAWLPEHQWQRTQFENNGTRLCFFHLLDLFSSKSDCLSTLSV